MHRATAFAAVVALHAGLVVILTVSLRTATRHPASADFVTTFIFLPSASRPAVNRPRPPIPEESTAISTPEPAAAPPPPTRVESGTGPSIDWGAEAERAAGAASAAPRTRSFGEMPQAPDWLRSTPSEPKHYAGESYRLGTGAAIVWVSDRCFIVSEPAPLWMPDVFARSIITRRACEAPPGPREGELFKDLPAYKKYHPQ